MLTPVPGCKCKTCAKNRKIARARKDSRRKSATKGRVARRPTKSITIKPIERTQKTMKTKLNRVLPFTIPPVKHPYVAGTEAGHFYLVLSEGSNGSVVGFRPLARNYVDVGEVPTEVQTRVRFVPSPEVDGPELDEAMLLLGFELRGSGTEDRHYSQVSSTPQTLINRALAVIKLIG